MKKYEQLQKLVAGMQDDFEKFYDKKNKAAGTRVRKGMQELSQFAKETRSEVQEMKNKGM